MNQDGWDSIVNMMERGRNDLFYFDIVKDEIAPNENISEIMKYHHCYKRSFKEAHSNGNQSDATPVEKHKTFKFK